MASKAAQAEAVGRGHSRPAWRVLLAAAGLHARNDAFFYVLYPLLPFTAAELGLSYAEVGLVNAAFAGSSCGSPAPSWIARPALG